MGIFIDNKINKFLNSPLPFKAQIRGIKDSSMTGCIQYGIKYPIKSAVTSIHECDINLKEKIEGNKPHYYFVKSDDITVKPKLLTAHLNRKGIISGIASDSGELFRYSINTNK